MRTWKDEMFTVICAFLIGVAVGFVLLLPKRSDTRKTEDLINKQIGNIDQMIEEITKKPIIVDKRKPNLSMQEKADLWQKRFEERKK